MRLEMIKKVIKLLGAIALTGWLGAANASLIFDFSFEDSNGIKITGEITGLQDNLSSQEASGVRILSVSDSDSGIYGFNVLQDVLNPDTGYFTKLSPFDENLFNVSNGVIVLSNFIVQIDKIGGYPTNQLTISINSSILGEGGFLFVTECCEFDGTTRDFSRQGPVIFTQRVPEPGTVIILSLGLVGLTFSQYRRKF
jgi:hypothetical protein